MRNVLAHAGKSGRCVVSALIATAFAQETPKAASAQWRTVADQIRPKLAALLDEAEPDILAYMSFPHEHRTKLNSSNPSSASWARCCSNRTMIGLSSAPAI